MATTNERSLGARRVMCILFVGISVTLTACADMRPSYRNGQWYTDAVQSAYSYTDLFSVIASNTDGVRRDLLIGTDEKNVDVVACSAPHLVPLVESRVERVRKLLRDSASTGRHSGVVRRQLEGVIADSAMLRKRIEQQWYETEGLKITPGERCLGAASLGDLDSIAARFNAILLLK